MRPRATSNWTRRSSERRDGACTAVSKDVAERKIATASGNIPPVPFALGRHRLLDPSARYTGAPAVSGLPAPPHPAREVLPTPPKAADKRTDFCEAGGMRQTGVFSLETLRYVERKQA